MPKIKLETVENHRMYCLMPSDNVIVKKSGTQAGIDLQSSGYRPTAHQNTVQAPVVYQCLQP